MCVKTKKPLTNLYGSVLKHPVFGSQESYNVTKFFWGVLGKFLARLRRAKKGVPKFFTCGGLFFVVEALKTVKTTKKPLFFRIFFQKPSNF